MSLLGLLDRMPDLEPIYDTPVFPSIMDELEHPLTPEETEDWQAIVTGLGDLALQDEEDPPIWREMSAKYASLMLGPEPALGQIWDSENWIQADFEDTWSMATPIWSSVAAPPRPRFSSALWQRSTRRSRPPALETDRLADDAPDIDVLHAAIRVIKASPQIDEAAPIPPASPEVRSRLAPLQRRRAGASNAAEMAARAASPELLAEMQRVAARR